MLLFHTLIVTAALPLRLWFVIVFLKSTKGLHLTGTGRILFRWVGVLFILRPVLYRCPAASVLLHSVSYGISRSDNVKERDVLKCVGFKGIYWQKYNVINMFLVVNNHLKEELLCSCYLRMSY